MSTKSFLTRPVIVLSFIVFVAALLAFGRFGSISEAGQQSSAMLPVTGSVAQSFPAGAGGDVDGDGKADPGDTIEYTVTVNNAGAGDATGVTIIDQLQNELTLVGGSLKISPIAVGDTFPVTGNITIQVPDGASDLLANDINPNTGDNTGLTVTAPATTAQGGSLNVLANGSFSYNPPPGFTGTDTATYTLTGANGATTTGTITFNVSGMIWFVNAAAPAGGDGRLNTPFNCYTGANVAGVSTCFSATAADEAGDNIFLFNGNYTGGNALLNNQKLIGQGAAPAGAGTLASIAAVTLAPFSDTMPSTVANADTVTITSAAAGVTLGQNNTLRGLRIGATTGAKISGNGFGSLVAGSSATPDLKLEGAGQALNLTNGTISGQSGLVSVTTTSSTAQGIILTQIGTTGTVNLGSTTVSGSTSQGILVQQSTGDINFGNTLIGTGSAGTGGTSAVSLQNNTGGTRTFGTLTIQNTIAAANAVAFLVTNGGSVTAGTTTITGVAGTGNAIDIKSLAAGTSVSFGATNVTKTTAGTLVNLGGSLASEPNIGSVTFGSLNGSASNGSGLVGTNNTGAINVNANAGSLTTTGGPAINITKAAAPLTPVDLDFTAVTSTGSATNGINFDRVSGSLNITGSGTPTSISNSTGTGIQIQNSSATFSFANTTNVAGTGNANTDATGTGIFLNANTGAITFGDLDIAPDAGERGLHSTGSTGTIATASGTITSATNTAVEVSGASAASLTPINMTLTTVSSASSAGPNGIILSNTGGTGFSIVGNGGTCTSAATCTGGTIANKTGADGSTTEGTGIYLSNVLNVTLNRMQINDFQNFAIRGAEVTNFTMRDSIVSGASGTSVPLDEGAVRFGTESAVTGIRGIALFEGNTIGGGREDNLSVFVAGSDTLTVTVKDNTVSGSQAIFNLNHAVDGNDALHISSAGTSNVTAMVDGVTFAGARGDILQVISTGSSTQNVTIQNNTFTNSHPAITQGGGEVNITGSGGSPGINVSYRIHNNTFKGSLSAPIYCMFGGFAGTIKGVVTNNTVGTPGGGYNNSQSDRGSTVGAAFFGGIDSKQPGNGILTYALRFEGNTIRDIEGTAGILLRSATQDLNGVGRVEATIKNNTFAEFGPSIAGAIYAQIAGASLNTDGGKMGLDIIGNTMTMTPGVLNSDAVGISETSQFADTYLPGYAGPASPFNEASTFLDNAPNNNNWTLGPNTGTGGVYVNGTIHGGAFVLAVPALADPAEEFTSQANTDSVDGLSLSNVSYQTPAEMLATLEPFETRSTGAAAISNKIIAAAGGEADSIGKSVKAGAETSETNYSETISAFFSEAFEKIGSAVSPIVEAQKKESSAPLAGETITINGSGSGFTIPSGKSLTVTFKAKVNDGPFNAGVNNISNNATVTGSPSVNVPTNTVSLLLDAAPSLEVTTTDAGATTQPGTTASYTLNYRNITSVKTQNATGVVVSHAVPTYATFNAASSTAGWSCADNAPAGTNCTFNVGALSAGGNGSVTFAVNVPDALPTDVYQLTTTASITDDGANGTDLNTADNSSNESTAIIGNWLGDASSNWFVATNWSNAVVPPAGNNISVPPAAPAAANSPSIPAAGSDVSIGKLTLNGANLSIGAGRTLTASGNVALGANIINGAGTLTLSAASNITRSTGQVESTLKKTFGAAGPLFTFPVGTVGAYSPVDVTVTAGAGDLSVKANTGTAPASPVALDATKTLQRFWTLNGSGITSDVTFNYLSGDVPGTANESAFHIVRAPIPTGTPTRFAPNGSQFILNAAGNSFTVKGLNVYSNWTLAEPLAPTAATVFVGGRVLDAQGRAVSGAQIALVDAEGNIRLARTNPFGYYRFFEVSAGSNYVVNVTHKLHEFSPQVVSPTEDTNELNFIATP